MARPGQSVTRNRRCHKQRRRQQVQGCADCVDSGLAGSFTLRSANSFTPACRSQAYLDELTSAMFKIHIRGLPQEITAQQVEKLCSDALGSLDGISPLQRGTKVVNVERLYHATPNEPFKKADVKLAAIPMKDRLIRRGILPGLDQGAAHCVSVSVEVLCTRAC